MCGIIGYIGNNNAKKIVYEGLLRLEYRGYDSWGIVSQKNKRVELIKNIGKISDANISTSKSFTTSLGHTRWATHGGVTKQNTHPHADCNKRFFIVHNGIVENYLSLKNSLKQKHNLLSQTDTEIIVHMFEEKTQRQESLQAFIDTVLSCVGYSAFVVLDSKTNQLFAYRMGSPLAVGFGKNDYCVASDPTAFPHSINRIYYVNDNECVLVSKKGIIIVNARQNKTIQPKFTAFDNIVVKTRAHKYSNNMLKEIHQQPDVLETIRKDELNQIPKLVGLIKKAKGVYFVGCGSASYASMTGAYFFSSIAKRHVNYAIGSEFPYQLEFLNKDSLVIALSQSGETMDTLEAMRFAKKKNAKLAALVNVNQSSLFRIVDYPFLLQAGPERAVCSTKAFSAKIATLLLCAYGISNLTNEGKQSIKKSVYAIRLLLQSSAIEKVSQKLKKADHIYIIGRGISYPVSLEASMKIKEITYTHAESFAGGELKHGVIALIEKNTPCIVFAPRDETYGAILSNAIELKARGAYIIGISSVSHEVFDDYIHVSDTGRSTAITNVIAGQLLAYHLALAKGIKNPDMPRNLAKSVTVK